MYTCVNNRVIDVAKYYPLRTEVFAVEQELNIYEADFDDKEGAKEALRNVLKEMEFFEELARKSCERDESDYCMSFSARQLSKARNAVQNTMSTLGVSVMRTEIGSHKLDEYLETFHELEANLATLEKTDMRYFKELGQYEYMQTDSADTQYVISLVKAAFAAKNVYA